MILSTHALVGAAIGKNIISPWAIVPIVLITHFILDGLRHGEYFDDRKDKFWSVAWRVCLDLFVAFAAVSGYIYLSHITSRVIFNMLLGSFFCLLPDFFSVLWYWKPKIKMLGQIKKFHSWAHHYKHFPKYGPERQWTLRNATNDIALSVFALVIIFFF